MCAPRVIRHTSIRYSSSCVSVCGNNLNILSMCAVSPVVHTSNISSCQKKKNFFFSFPSGCEQFHKGRSFGSLVINVCNHGEHYETPCIFLHYLINARFSRKNWLLNVKSVIRLSLQLCLKYFSFYDERREIWSKIECWSS